MKRFCSIEGFCVLCSKWCTDLCGWPSILLKFCAENIIII
jgi:hypothetical protein